MPRSGRELFREYWELNIRGNNRLYMSSKLCVECSHSVFGHTMEGCLFTLSSGKICSCENIMTQSKKGRYNAFRNFGIHYVSPKLS